MKYYYLLVFVFFFANVVAQNNDGYAATGSDASDPDEALYKKVETLRQFCELNLNETEDDVKAFNQQICEFLAELNAGDTDGAQQTAKEIFASNTVPAAKKQEVLEKNKQLMKEIEESVHASYNNDASNSNSASNSNDGQS